MYSLSKCFYSHFAMTYVWGNWELRDSDSLLNRSIELPAFHWSMPLTRLHLFFCLHRHCQLWLKVHVTCPLQPLYQVQECGMNTWSSALTLEMTSLSVLAKFLFFYWSRELLHTVFSIISVFSISFSIYPTCYKILILVFTLTRPWRIEC